MQGTDRPAPTSTAPEAAATTPPLLTAMTGLRALPCIWVLLYHLRDAIYAVLPGTTSIAWFIEGGYLTIDVFFLLSGFIIAYNYGPKLANADSAQRRDYLIARVARIYPVHLFALLLTLALVGTAALLGRTLNANQDYDVLGFLANVLVLQAVPGVELWNIPSWSVCCEMVAYLLFPLAAARLMRVGQRSAWLLGFGLLGVQAALMAALFGSPYSMYALFWVRIVTEFSAGALLWAAWRYAPIRGRRCDVAVVGATAAFLAVLVVGVPAPWSFLAVPLLAVVVVATAGVTGPVRTFLSSRVIQRAGLASYSIYLVHIPVYQAMLLFYPLRAFVDQPLAVRIGAVVGYHVAMIAVGLVVFHLVEEPARRWLRRRVTPLVVGRRPDVVPLTAAERTAATGLLDTSGPTGAPEVDDRSPERGHTP